MLNITFIDKNKVQDLCESAVLSFPVRKIKDFEYDGGAIVDFISMIYDKVNDTNGLDKNQYKNDLFLSFPGLPTNRLIKLSGDAITGADYFINKAVFCKMLRVFFEDCYYDCSDENKKILDKVFDNFNKNGFMTLHTEFYKKDIHLYFCAAPGYELSDTEDFVWGKDIISKRFYSCIHLLPNILVVFDIAAVISNPKKYYDFTSTFLTDGLLSESNLIFESKEELLKYTDNTTDIKGIPVDVELDKEGALTKWDIYSCEDDLNDIRIKSLSKMVSVLSFMLDDCIDYTDKLASKLYETKSGKDVNTNESNITH